MDEVEKAGMESASFEIGKKCTVKKIFPAWQIPYVSIPFGQNHEHIITICIGSNHGPKIVMENCKKCPFYKERKYFVFH